MRPCGTIVPVPLSILIDIDRILSEGRTIVTVLGNVVATIIIGRREHAIDLDRMRHLPHSHDPGPLPTPETATPTPSPSTVA